MAGVNIPAFPIVPVCGRSAPDAAPDMWPSASNPFYMQRASAPYGRQLRGFGLVPDTPKYADTWSGSDPAVLAAAQADDVAGNGIFDGAGSPPTAHAGSGVFESRFSLPGYLYREQPTEPSEVRDTTTGMPVVYQPDAGGSWYEDTRDAYRPYDLETPRLYTSLPRLPRPARFDLGAVEFSAETAKGFAMWGALGAMAAMGATLIWRLAR